MPAGGHHISNVHGVLISGVSVGQCAKLCVEEDTFECVSFAYCDITTECRLNTTWTARNVSSALNQSCYIYSSKFIS